MIDRDVQVGDTVLMGDRTVGIVEGTSYASVYPTMWLKTCNGSVPWQIHRKDYLILEPPTHIASFKRNIYFGGFSWDDLVRKIILLENRKDIIYIMVDVENMRWDSVLTEDVTLTPINNVQAEETRTAIAHIGGTEQ